MFDRTSHDNQLRFARLSFLLTCVLLGLSAYYYQPRYIGNYTGFYLFLLSLPFIRFSFPLFSETPSHANSDTAEPSNVIWWGWLAVSVVCMTLLTMMNMPQTWMQPWQQTLGLMNASPHVQMLLLCIGLITVIHGFGGHLLPHRINWERHHTILLGIVLLGGSIRFWNLEYAIHMFMDELLFLADVIEIESDTLPIFLPSTNAFTDNFGYMQFLVKQVTGASLTTLRIPSVILGVLGIIGIYVLARQFFSVRLALLSAFLLAIMPVHIHFSRIGINNMAGSALGIWLFVYVIRGIRDQRLGDFAIAGVLLGLTHYFYEGERLFFIPFVILFIIWSTLFCRRDPILRLPQIKPLMITIFCTILVITPLYHTLSSHNHTLTQRLNVSRSPDFLIKEGLTDFLLGSELGVIGAPIQRYVQLVDYDDFYQAEEAYISPFLVPFFLLGFGILLWQIRTIRGSLFIWWVLGVAIGNSLIFDGLSAPNPRYVVVYGILMLVSAVGIHTMWAVLTEWVQERWRRWVQVGFLLYLGGLGLYQVGYYFNTIVPNFHEYVFTRLAIDGTPRPTYDDMILRAVQLPENTTLHVLTNLTISEGHTSHVPQFFGRLPDEFIVEHTLVDDFTIDYLESLPRDRNHVFTFMSYDESALVETIEQVFDITQIESSPFDIPDNVEMKFYHVSMTNKP